MDGAVPVRFLKSVLNNGVTRYVPQLQRLTFQFSKITGADRGVRDYVEKNVEMFCEQHPNVVVYILPVEPGASSRIIAEYLNGNNLSISLRKMSEEQVKYWVHMFLSKSGQRDFKLKNMHHTEVPSIQGQWSPLTYKHKQLFAHRFIKVFDAKSGSYRIQVQSANTACVSTFTDNPSSSDQQNVADSSTSSQNQFCPESVNDVPATNGLFTRVGAF